MHSWVALSRTEHAQHHWQPRRDFEFAAAQQIVPVMLAELTKLLPHYALGFIKDENEAYQAVALVGLGGERNLYTTAESKWLCSYVPAALRAYPFALLKDADQNKDNAQTILCIDESFITRNEACPRLFKDDGELEDRVAEVLKFTTQCKQNRQLTKLASGALATAGVIEPWPVSIERGASEEPLKVNGVHRINELALNELDCDGLADLRSTGALALAYAQLFSTAQLEQLTQRAEYHQKTAKRSAPPASLSGLFSSEDSGSLNFDAFDSVTTDVHER